MLTPAPSVYQSSPDLIAVNNPSQYFPIASDTCPSSSIQQPQQYRSRSIPKARPSKLSRASLNYHRHHHHNRPSKQFVATNSNAIFGDWDIELKISHRLAKTKGTGGRAAVINGRGGASARGSGGGRNGGGGASITIGSGPGAQTGSSGLHPLSTFPSSVPAPASSATLGTQNPALNIQKGELTPTPSTDLPKDNNNNNKNNNNSKTTTKISTKSTAPWGMIEQSTNTNVGPSALATSTKSTTTTKKQQDETMENAHANSLPSASARSSFLKALGKFKSKHLQQKRSSAPPSSLLFTPAPNSTLDKRASYIIPPIKFDEPESDMLALPASYPEPEKDTTRSPTPEISIHHTLPHPEEHNADGTSSLRVKFKNKVNSTLASMKSSSNLREKSKAQQESLEPPVVRQKSLTSFERRLSAIVVSSTADATESGSSNVDGSKSRNSKTFWTFPRARLEPNQTSKAQVSWGANSSISIDNHNPESMQDTDMRSLEPESEPVDDGSSTLLQQLQQLKVEELDSDNSLDIILPADYEDYTQFAELPLKKRKKMERSLAAASEPTRQGPFKRPNSMRVSADAMRRFLKQETIKTNSKEGDESRDTIVEIHSRDISAVNGNKKRPQLSTESDNSSKRSGIQASEWRRSLLKTLHLSKGQQGVSKVGNAGSNQSRSQTPSTLIATNEASKVQSSSQPANPATTRPTRSNTASSARSRSLSNATHPALLAAAMSKPRSPGLRRETLEMAMRRRRQSSAARSNISDTEVPPPLPFSSEFFNIDNISTTNITHTFTSFTLELAEMYAQDVMNNSAVPGLFNFKRRAPRLTVSSNVMELDTDQEFRAFDSDGDAISGYTGDADVSMDEFNAGSPKWSTAPKLSSDNFKSRARELSFTANSSGRRKMSSIDGDSDTVPELPTLTIRTRDLNRSSGGRGSGGGSYSRMARPVSGSSLDIENDAIGRDSPRSPRRTGNTSPVTLRKASRGILHGSTSPTSAYGPSSSAKSSRAPMSMEEIVSWKPKNGNPQSRPQIPMLDTKPLKPSRGSGLSTSTTLIPSSRIQYSQMTQSPVLMSPGSDEDESFMTRQHYHQQSSSSSSSRYPQHQHQTSGDTLVPNHLRYISTASTMSAGSGYSAQTLGGYHQYQASSSLANAGNMYSVTEAQEFDPSGEFSPTTPADLKSMDFEALLATAEREQQKGWDDLVAQKKEFEYSAPSKSKVASTITTTASRTAASMPTKSSLQRQQQPDVPPLRIAPSLKSNRSNQQYQQRGSLAFDLGPSDDGGAATTTGTGTGSDRSLRSKRVMKKKMSVIRLAGNGNANIQGRREDDGMIRVSLSPTPYSSSNLPPSEYASSRW
ncbi:hypothetical protein BGX27_009305 [Mortierella sp. AM989]|nr:hypothetical protein BGX27_009305 [Mortierella sp. AM989]